MLRIICILVVALVLESIGVVFLSGGLKQIGGINTVSAGEIVALIKRGVTNRHILTGVLFEAIFFGALLYLLSQQDVSLIWPLTALGFVLTTLAAKFFLHEEVSATRWGGVILIVTGAMLITYAERKAPKPPPSENRPPANVRL
jgi:uncharacterized membrane protein